MLRSAHIHNHVVESTRLHSKSCFNCTKHTPWCVRLCLSWLDQYSHLNSGMWGKAVEINCGRVAVWPCGRVAVWPGGRVAVGPWGRVGAGWGPGGGRVGAAWGPRGGRVGAGWWPGGGRVVAGWWPGGGRVVAGWWPGGGRVAGPWPGWPATKKGYCGKGGAKKVTYIFWVPHGDMLQFLAPRVPPPKYFRGCSWGGALEM